MKASELKVGNYVLIPRIDSEILIPVHPKKIKGISKFDELDFTEPEYPEDLIVSANLCSGIPLTEEWLRKLHSEDEIEKNGRFPNEITIYDRFLFIWKESYKYWYVVTAYHKEYLTKIEFVHEYQNFIFSCNGTELTIK